MAVPVGINSCPQARSKARISRLPPGISQRNAPLRPGGSQRGNGNSLAFNNLPPSCIQRLVCSVPVNLNLKFSAGPLSLGVKKVSLANDAALPLFEIGWAPWNVKMVKGHQAVLDVHASPHL